MDILYIPLTGECSQNRTQCEEGTLCYQNSIWWSACHKKCPDDISCTKAVNDMTKEVEKLKDDERINGFAKAQLYNPSWLDNVLNAFVQPYIDRDGNWDNVINECYEMFDPFFYVDAKYRCQKLMAEYHISNDLQNALNKNGCGTEKDWDMIGEHIKSCVEESDMNILYTYFAKEK